MMNHASRLLPHSRQADAIARKSSSVPNPRSTTPVANPLFSHLLAHISLHHATSSSVSNFHRLAPDWIRQLRVQNGRAQVTEQAQLRTDFQQAALRANVTFDGVPLRATHGAQQLSVSSTSRFQGLDRKSVV